MKKKKVLLIYTGGTIGMVKNHLTGRLEPVDFDNLLSQIPALKKFNCRIDALFFSVPIDSSDAGPETWLKLIKLIEKHYEKYDGFVILHGTDTMAYSASALSFMIEDLQKPIVFTGSQLPLEMIRTDGKENLITSIEIASSDKAPKEVCIYFEDLLLRGNRTTKFSSEHFDAFKSPNFPPLAEAGVHIEYNPKFYLPANRKKTQFHKTVSDKIAVITFYPGIREDQVTGVLENENNKGIVLQTFGSGNIPNQDWLRRALDKAIQEGKLILNTTHCIDGGVEQGKYENSAILSEVGAISGLDISLEAAVTKMMFLLGTYSTAKAKRLLAEVLSGEMETNQ
ncbi:MAG: asparaginase [Bacteroidota bacterium]